MGEDEKEKICSFCWDCTEESVVQACGCKGTIAWRHPSCIERWVNLHNGCLCCNICHEHFETQAVETKRSPSHLALFPFYTIWRLFIFPTITAIFFSCYAFVWIFFLVCNWCMFASFGIVVTVGMRLVKKIDNFFKPEGEQKIVFVSKALYSETCNNSKKLK